MFSEQVKTCGKGIYEHLDGLKSFNSQDECISWCLKTYSVHHKLRDNVETLDNVEAIRVFLKQRDLRVGNLILNVNYKTIIHV